MIRFDCDYLEGCFPEILEALSESNFEQTPGYGEDEHCENACRIIREVCGAPQAKVHLLVGGTQTNVTVISSLLKPYQGVVCPDSGHINIHETGALEHIGHKALALQPADGKISASQIEEALVAHRDDFSREHMVQPGMVYISFPTERGTIYSKKELSAISSVCRKWRIPLFIDGARLGYGLMSPECELTIEDIATLADVFYIGGTKQGALFGEAVVFTDPAIAEDFRYNIKQNGGMLAKGRLLGIQFETLFGKNLYFTAAERAVKQAFRIRRAFEAKGFRFWVDSPTNQQFPILTAAAISELEKDFGFEIWQKLDEDSFAVRFCTSWATADSSVDALVSAVAKL
jgi:Threonine aldolase